MGFVKQAMLLLLLAAVGTYAESKNDTDTKPDADPCQTENYTIPVKDVHKLVGHWVLVWSIANHPNGTALLKQLNISHVELTVSPDNKTLRFLERNVLKNNSYVEFDLNITLPEDHDNSTFSGRNAVYRVDSVEEKYPGAGDLKFFQSAENTLTLIYKEGQLKFLLFYKRQGFHHDHDHEKGNRQHFKLAECLNFTEHFFYKYLGDSVAGPKEKPAESDPTSEVPSETVN